jgi:hypothetical protein
MQASLSRISKKNEPKINHLIARAFQNLDKNEENGGLFPYQHIDGANGDALPNKVLGLE